MERGQLPSGYTVGAGVFKVNLDVPLRVRMRQLVATCSGQITFHDSVLISNLER